MRIFGGQRSFFVGKQSHGSVFREYDVGTPGWWVLGIVLYLLTTAFLTLFVVLLADLSFLASLGLGAVGAAAMMVYWFVSSFRH